MYEFFVKVSALFYTNLQTFSVCFVFIFTKSGNAHRLVSHFTLQFRHGRTSCARDFSKHRFLQKKKHTFTQFLIRILTAYRRYSVCRTDSLGCPSYSVLGFRQLVRVRASRYSGSRCRSAAMRICCALPFFRG